MPLTDTQVKKARQPGDKPIRIYDERGLYLEVRRTADGGAAKWWRFKFRFDGKEKLLSLGTYPDVSLADARRRRDKAREQVAAGINPSEAKKAEKASGAAENSFEAIAREWHRVAHARQVGEGHAGRTLTRLEQDIFPWIGSRPIGDITAPELLQALRRIEARGAIETAHRARQACGQVFRHAIATGRARHDPTSDLREALKPVIVEHMPAITEPKRVGELLRSIASYQGQHVTRAALQLAPLVFVRPGELRKAEWAEIDLDAAEWRIPGDRIERTRPQKASGAPHIVPLSRQAVAVLRDLQPLTGQGRYVFPSLLTRERPMSDNAVLTALRRMGYPKQEMTGHGFRAMARTLLAERLGADEAVLEAQLAHGAKRNRSEFLQQRRAMLQQWADYLDTLRDGGDDALP